MLKVAPCTVSRTVGRLYSCTSNFFRLDGLLLFCIIMGLCYVSSAIIVNFYHHFPCLTFNSMTSQTLNMILWKPTSFKIFQTPIKSCVYWLFSLGKKVFPSFFITFLTRTVKYHHFPAFAWWTLSLCALGVALHLSEMNPLTSWSFFKTSADLCSIKDLLYASIASLSFSCLE